MTEDLSELTEEELQRILLITIKMLGYVMELIEEKQIKTELKIN